MSDSPQVPWWYSGQEAPPAGDDAPAGGGPSGWTPGLDLFGLLSGAQRLVDWAADAVLAPHAEHDDPRAHPQCLVCRASLLLGDVARGTAGGAAGQEAGPQGSDRSGVRWLPIRE